VQVPDIPKNANSQAIRTIKVVAKPYESLVKAYQEGDFQKLQAEVNVGLQVWDEVSHVAPLSFFAKLTI
jgi:hypothetical protein